MRQHLIPGAGLGTVDGRRRPLTYRDIRYLASSTALSCTTRAGWADRLDGSRPRAGATRTGRGVSPCSPGRAPPSCEATGGREWEARNPVHWQGGGEFDSSGDSLRDRVHGRFVLHGRLDRATAHTSSRGVRKETEARRRGSGSVTGGAPRSQRLCQVVAASERTSKGQCDVQWGVRREGQSGSRELKPPKVVVTTSQIAEEHIEVAGLPANTRRGGAQRGDNLGGVCRGGGSSPVRAHWTQYCRHKEKR